MHEVRIDINISEESSILQVLRRLFSDVVLMLSRLFQIDALTVWTLCYEQSLILHCVTKRLIINYYC